MVVVVVVVEKVVVEEENVAAVVEKGPNIEARPRAVLSNAIIMAIERGQSLFVPATRDEVRT
jgi:hypothetical protein